MQTMRVEPCRHRDLPAWRIAGDALEVVISAIGAQIAVLRRPGDDCNPLWQPHWPSRDPALVPMEADGPYGSGPIAPLLAGIVGHTLCCDRFGPPWPGEGRTVHGEAPVMPWYLDQEAADGVWLRTYLPQSDLHLRRGHFIDGDRLRVETVISHDGGEPRAVEWAEHLVLGDPFLDGLRTEVSVDTFYNMPGDVEPACRFPGAGPLGAIPAARALAMPRAEDPCISGDILAGLVAEARCSMINERLAARLDLSWERADFPWLCLWTEHRSRPQAPWNGRERARGVEFSSKPFPEGRPPPERATRWLDQDTTCIVPPGAGKRSVFHLRWQRD